MTQDQSTINALKKQIDQDYFIPESKGLIEAVIAIAERASTSPKPPRETPVRLWGIRSYLHSHGMVVLCCPAITGPPTNEDWVEIKAKPDGTFYIEDQQ